MKGDGETNEDDKPDGFSTVDCGSAADGKPRVNELPPSAGGAVTETDAEVIRTIVAQEIINNYAEYQGFGASNTIGWAEEVFNQSKGELKNLSPNEEASLIFYTGQDFRWFNEILYNRVSNPEEIRHDLPDNPHAPFSDQVEGLLYGGDYSLEEKDKTYEFAQEVVANMDAALSKAPKRQRVLYRGMSKGNKAFQHLNNNVSQITKWVDENLTLGQEIVFEGYQSSTVNPDIAKSYSGFGGGIVYEILTPEGINITSQSYYPDENEVILPRDSRYMVVGKHKAKLKWDDELPTHIIQLVAINNKGEVLDGTNSDDPSEI